MSDLHLGKIVAATFRHIYNMFSVIPAAFHRMLYESKIGYLTHLAISYLIYKEDMRILCTERKGNFYIRRQDGWPTHLQTECGPVIA